jgi:hypothetical protein
LMTQRTVKRLLTNGLLSERPNSLGGISLFLTTGGVKHLRLYGFDAQTGYDLSSISGAQFYHRTLGTAYLVERAASGHTALGEYSLFRTSSKFRYGALAEHFNKRPDGLVLVPGETRGYEKGVLAADWIEVEAGFKPKDELGRILAIAWKAGCFLDAAETVILDRVVFVYNKEQDHERYIRAALRAYLNAHPIQPNSDVLRSIVFARCDVTLPLVYHGHEEITAADLLQRNTLPDTAPEDL